jgi:ABC-2 type transport system permease protein
VGLFAASATGPWPLAILIVTAGAVAGLATGVGGVLLGVVAVLLQFALCLVTSRLITTSLSGALRSRRGRDLLAVAAIFFILLAQLPNIVINRGLWDEPAALLAAAAAVLRWTPPGLAAHAIADGGVVGLAELLVLAVLVLAIGWLWIVALRRSLVSADASTQAGSVRRSRGGGVGRFLPDGQLAAVVTKELKYARRDPRGRVGWLASIAVTGVLAISLSGSENGPTGQVLAIGPACLGALMIGLQAGNSFGIDGRSLWMNSVAYGSEQSLRTDLAGRHLAATLIATPLLILLSIVTSLLAGNLVWSLPAMFTAWGLLGVSFGVGAMTSVIFPYTAPDRLNAFTGAAPGQGGIAFLGTFGAMIGSGVLILPVLLPLLFGVTWLSVVAVPYGLAVAWAGRRLAGRIGFARFPELLAAVSKPS